MLTLKLWRALNHPPRRTAIYRRAYVRHQPPEPTPALRLPGLRLFTAFFRNLGIAVLPVLIILVGTPIAMLLFYIALLMTPFLMPLANTLYGLAHAISASGRIARERDHHTYDVICASPQGVLGVHWAYCTGWLHYHATFRQALVVVLVIAIIACVFGLPAQVIFGADQASTFTVIVRALALGALFLVDYAQTIVISSLAVLLAPTYTENERSARLWAASLFLALQLGVYLPTLLIGVVALPAVYPLLGVDAALGAVVTPLLYVTFFAVLREVIIAGLWYRVREQLSATAVELDALTRAAV